MMESVNRSHVDSHVCAARQRLCSPAPVDCGLRSQTANERWFGCPVGLSPQLPRISDFTFPSALPHGIAIFAVATTSESLARGFGLVPNVVHSGIATAGQIRGQLGHLPGLGLSRAGAGDADRSVFPCLTPAALAVAPSPCCSPSRQTYPQRASCAPNDDALEPQLRVRIVIIVRN